LLPASAADRRYDGAVGRDQRVRDRMQPGREPGREAKRKQRGAFVSYPQCDSESTRALGQLNDDVLFGRGDDMRLDFAAQDFDRSRKARPKSAALNSYFPAGDSYGWIDCADLNSWRFHSSGLCHRRFRNIKLTSRTVKNNIFRFLGVCVSS
jgi:hypothetical protein